MKRILVPLDGSVRSEAVLPVAETVTRAHRGVLRLLRALPPRDLREPSPEAPPVGDAQAYLARLTERLRGRGVPYVFWTLWHAQPDQAIVSAATQGRVDLILMASHGHGDPARGVLGSVAERVVRRAPVPVLLLRASLSGTLREVEDVLVPTRGLSPEALRFVEWLAVRCALSVTLLHLVRARPGPGPDGWPGDGVLRPMTADRIATLARAVADLRAKGIPVAQALTAGPAA